MIIKLVINVDKNYKGIADANKTYRTFLLTNYVSLFPIFVIVYKQLYISNKKACSVFI